MSGLVIPKQRRIDAICLGRAGVDLYALEADTDMVEVSGFQKQVGGSPANIAVALAKLGCKAGIISCVSDDGLGRYVRHYLAQQGVDLQGMQVLGAGTRTSLAVTEMKASECEVVIYRNNAADLSLDIGHIDRSYIADARALVITGTALSCSPSREASLQAISYARESGTLVVLDIDYRAYSWSSVEESAVYCQMAAAQADILIGNREEFDVLESLVDPDNRDDDRSADRFLAAATQVVVIKAGELGSKVYTRWGEQFSQGVFPVKMKKPFGSGDSFAGALLYALLNGLDLQSGVRMGSAAAAINVSGDSCTEAMPTLPELETFIARHEQEMALC
ncbi:5-dehydro-2-deoxygluconokinase [Motiliproteus sp. MSK22-1]|uniref:5-dehydro-2-deoxygluconokinase n=1 Tax=Motiliproteus sp. MSK22-1 TaxID=1897630 RepID=UPI000978B14E|nr:5-dehydro-2-deoxygluconokinase [Motiliproteus sp. MSK22-1]OMH38932.1 5-dehydro-2-deoxygluconokinase [Motiliproteus sp. MSK22-1]